MSDFDSQHELDDELLSAYLDEELSPEERAAVEARLAADPVAEQTLRQLRAVSQAVQGLPQEAVGYDLRESVLQRAAEQKAPNRTTAAVSPAANAVKRGSENGATVKSADSMPTFSIGRTRRAWVWASLAVAAALLVMVFDAGQRRREDLPAIAHRDRPAGGEDMPRQRSDDDQVAFRALSEQPDEPAAPAAVPFAARDEAAAPESRTRALAENGSAVDAAAPRGAISLRDQVAQNTDMDVAGTPLAQQNEPADSLGVALRGDSDAAAPERSFIAPTAETPAAAPAAESLAMSPEAAREPQAADGLGDVPSLNKQIAEPESDRVAAGELLVVRVVAKRAAIQSKAIDRVLERNGITVADEASDEVAPRSAPPSRDRVPQQSQRNVRARVDGVTAEAQTDAAEQDALLVQATPAAIEACLEMLHSDTENYVGLQVADATTADAEWFYDAGAMHDYFQEAKEAPRKKTAEQFGWTKYGRGSVPPQDESLARTKTYLHYGLEAQTDRYEAGESLRGGRGGADKLDQSKPQLDRFGTTRGAGWNRALRLKTSGPAEAKPGEPDARRRDLLQDEISQQTATARRSESQLQLGTAAEPGGNLVPVLFVLTPVENPAPSPATEDRAE